MTDQERTLISDLADRIKSTPPQTIDRDADDLIRRTIGTRPDALYLLTQIVLMQQMALNQARNQIEDLQQGQPQPAGGGSFLQSGYAAQPPAYQQQGYAAPPPPQPAYAQPSGGGFSGFLRNAAQTAAGVMAGEIAFDSLRSIFGHHEGSGFLGGGGSYLDDSGLGGGSGESRFSEAADQNQDISPDIEDDRDSSGDDFSSDDSGDDFSSGDNS